MGSNPRIRSRTSLFEGVVGIYLPMCVDAVHAEVEMAKISDRTARVARCAIIEILQLS